MLFDTTPFSDRKYRWALWLLALAGLYFFNENNCLILLDAISGATDNRFWCVGLSTVSIQVAGLSTGFLLIGSPLLSGWKNRESIIISSLFVTAYFLAAEKRPFDTPCWDDFNALLEWFDGWKSQQGLADRTTWLLTPYWECKTFVSRTVSVLLQATTGEHFLHVQKYINGGLLVVTAWMFSLSFAEGKPRTSVFLSSILLLFNFQHFHTALCAFSGTTYYLTAIFALAAFRSCDQRTTSAFLSSILWGALAAWTFGNGWIVLPLVVVSLLSRRELKLAAIATVFTVILAFVYFYGYRPERLNRIDSFSVRGYLEFSAIFLGNSMQFLYYPYLPLLSALFVAGTALVGTWRWIIKQVAATPFFLLLLFLVGTALLAGIFRHQAGTYQAYSVRYGYFSLLAIWTAVLCLIERKESNWFTIHGWKMVAFAALLTLSKSFFFYPEMVVAQEEYREVLIDWKRKGMEVPANTPFYPRGIGRLLDNAESTGTWRLKGRDTAVVNRPMFTIRYIDESNRWKEE